MMRRRGSSGVVWALFTLGIVIVVGALLFAKVFPKLEDQQDADFSAAANSTISGVEDDFYDAVDLLRIALIIVPIVAVLAYVFMIRGKG